MQPKLKRTNWAIIAAGVLYFLAAPAAGAVEPAAPLQESGRDLYFQRIGVAAGITPDVITTVYRDRLGLLWVGTREGLYRFDGRSTLRFVNNAEDPGSICDNSIRTVFEDRDGRLWVGSNTGGLCRLDPGRSTFITYRHDSADAATLSHDSVYSIDQDAHGYIWAGTQAGLNRIDPIAGTVVRIPVFTADSEFRGREYIAVLRFDADGALWVGTVGGGLYRSDTGAAAFEGIGPDRGITDESVFSLLIDSDGDLWVGAESGVYRRHAGDGGFQKGSFESVLPSGHVAVTSLIQMNAKEIFGGTFGAGLLQIDRNTMNMRWDAERKGRPGSLVEGRVTGLLIDAGGGLVVATWGGGLQRATLSSWMFAGVNEFVDATGALAELGDVQTLYGGEGGGVWVGSGSHGLAWIDESAAVPTALPYPIGDPDRPPPIFALLAGRSDRLWIGSSDALIRYRPSNQHYERFAHDPGDERSLGAGYVTAVLRDADGVLWIGTGGSGLWRMREGEGRFKGYRHDPGRTDSLSGDYITALATDGQGILWVGTRSSGLNRCGTRPFRCRRFPAGPGDGLRHQYVTHIHRDPAGELWVASAGGGVQRVRRGADGGVERFEHLGAADGLVEDNVMAMLDDNDGSLWLATRKGLSRVSRNRRQIMNYLAGDGLISDIFNRGSAARTDRYLYFGSVNGVVRIAAGTPFPAPVAAPLVFTGVRNLTARTALSGPAGPIESLTVEHGQVLQFHFALLDFETERQSFEYRLSDRNPWTEIADSRQITFGDLPPGRHVLEVRGRGARGMWSSARIGLEILPRFWMTYWFKLLLVTAVILAALLAHNWRIAALQRRHRELQMLHAQREQALTLHRRAERELSEAAQGLRRLAARLEVAKEEERQHISRELHDELGQTLTAAKISLQLLQTEAGSGDAAGRIRSAVEMMDAMIGKVRAISLNLRPPLLDEAGLVPALQHELQQAAARTGIDVGLEVSEDFPHVEGAPALVLFRACQEAVSNSLRHAGASRIRIRLDTGEGCVHAVIEDDGVGFDLENVKSRVSRGEHLGLLGLDERVTSLGGAVTLNSAPGRGTRLTVAVPWGDAS